jgi:hypothetical protein
MNKEIIPVFIKRMKKLGIEVELVGNIPWIYIDKINGKRIKKEDYFQGNHGFTIAFYPIRNDQVMEFTDISRIIKLIRKYR